MTYTHQVSRVNRGEFAPKGHRWLIVQVKHNGRKYIIAQSFEISVLGEKTIPMLAEMIYKKICAHFNL